MRVLQPPFKRARSRRFNGRLVSLRVMAERKYERWERRRCQALLAFVREVAKVWPKGER